MGPRTEEFEKAFSERVPGHAVAVTNGTAALHLAAAALGIGPGDEVICPTLTFVASAAAMVQAGAAIRLADSTSLDDFSIDPDEIERLVSPRTKAVVVVHYGGAPANTAAILAVAKKHELFVIEDAAHALGSEIDGAPCGSIGDAGCFSFFPNKNLTTGEGGMTVFRDEQRAQKARLLRSHGMTALTWDRHRGHATGYDVVEFGFNYRIDEPRSALGLVQLARLDELNAARARLAARYRENLAGSPFVVPSLGGRGVSGEHLCVALAGSTTERDRARERLRDELIQTSVHYPVIHRFSRYRAEGERLPVAEEIADRVFTLPLHPKLTARDVDDVCVALLEE